MHSNLCSQPIPWEGPVSPKGLLDFLWTPISSDIWSTYFVGVLYMYFIILIDIIAMLNSISDEDAGRVFIDRIFFIHQKNYQVFFGLRVSLISVHRNLNCRRNLTHWYSWCRSSTLWLALAQWNATMIKLVNFDILGQRTMHGRQCWCHYQSRGSAPWTALRNAFESQFLLLKVYDKLTVFGRKQWASSFWSLQSL